MPPTEPMPMDWRSSAPKPPENAIGSMPKSAATQLIRIGLNRVAAARRTASRFGTPAFRRFDRSSISRIAAFTTTPTSMMPARSPKIESVVPARRIAANRPRYENGIVKRMMNGCVHDSSTAASSR